MQKERKGRRNMGRKRNMTNDSAGGGNWLLRNAVYENTLRIFNYNNKGNMNAEHDNDITLWLLLAERKGLLSLAGESRIPSRLLSSADSGLRATGWFTQQDGTIHHRFSFISYTVKLRLLTQNSCNTVKNKTSPCLIPTCESILTVNKEVKTTQRGKRTILNWQGYLDLKIIFSIQHL